MSGKLVRFVICFMLGAWSKIAWMEPATLVQGVFECSKEIDLVAVGDVIIHQPITTSAWDKEKGYYDFRPIFEPMIHILREADLCVAVLETVLAGEKARGYSGYPMFNSPDVVADALKWAGVDLVFTAHNHILDRGEMGVLRTIKVLNSLGLHHVGANPGPDPSTRVAVLNVKGIRLAFLSYTTATNGIPTPEGKNWLVHRFDSSSIQMDIQRARRLGAEAIICALHAGAEYKREPDSEQLEAVNLLMKYGVDVVLGSHPHAVQPVAYWRLDTGEVPRLGFVAYSLGNFLSNQRWRYSDSGLLVRLKIKRQRRFSGVTVAGVETIPIWVHKYRRKGKHQYRILPITDGDFNPQDALLTPEDRWRIEQVWQDTKETIEAIPIIN
jgi:poly-gamma-glutamate capsule biosynthesis protein CapA/YwtB (metallophosphatase superfamily)